MWDFVEIFYHEQGEEDTGYVTEKYLEGLAEQVPALNLATWTSDRSNNALVNQVETDRQAANNAGFTGTPSFLLGKSGGSLTKFEPGNLTSGTAFDEAIEKLLS
jgi:protein-disulfide isomerase